MAFHYYPASKEDFSVDDKEMNLRERSQKLRFISWKNFFILISLLGNVYLLLPLFQPSVEEYIPIDYAKTREITTEWKNFWWHTEYSPKNHSNSDALWDAILPSHGFVAMDRKWAEENQWPSSMYLPSDKSKGVYLLEAYHQLHCLRILRKTFWEAVENKEYTYHPSSHMEHCFDTLRQSVQCNADNTPLYTFGDKTAGNGQVHRCRNWDELRDFATKNTACYRDSIEDIPLGEHFGYCDDGHDGLL